MTERSPAKTSLFKRPSWARARQSPSPETNDHVEVDFNRSAAVLEQLRKDKDEKERRKQQKDAKKDKRKANADRPDGKKDVKRTKAMKVESLAAEDSSAHGTRELEDSGNEDIAIADERYGNEESRKPGHAPRIPVPITIDSEDEDDDIQIQDISDTVEGARSTEKPNMPVDDAQYFSDEDLSDYTREERKRRKKQAEREPPDATQSSISSSLPGIGERSSEVDQGPVLKLLVTSNIPDSSPLIVHRRSGQRLKEVRMAWCDKQGFSAEMKAMVFLTWRKRRLFDITTCKSLGVSVDGLGKTVIKGERNKGWSNDDGTEQGVQLHLEAWTQELFDKAAREREQEKSQASQRVEESAKKASPPPAQEAPSVTVILKAKDMEEVKLLVRPTTLVSRLVDGFRHQCKIPSSKLISLVFDGEKLDNGASIDEADVADMDYIEVYIK